MRVVGPGAVVSRALATPRTALTPLCFVHADRLRLFFSPPSQMKIIPAWLATAAALATVACSGSREAKTRKEQEVEFTKAFGFPPASTIQTIRYFDRYQRVAMDGAYGQWLAFSFDQASFDRILLAGYKKEHGSITTGDRDAGAPSWWPKTIPASTVVFSRSQDDTPDDEGFQFREHLWHDPASGLVFFHKSHWD